MHTGGCNARARPSGKGPTTPTAPPTTLRCVGATAQEGATARSRTPHHAAAGTAYATGDRKSTRLNSSHSQISYAVFCLKKKKKPTLQLSEHQEPSNIVHTSILTIYPVSAARSMTFYGTTSTPSLRYQRSRAWPALLSYD